MNDGKYKGRVVGNVVLGESAKKGTPFIQFYGEITEGEFKGERARYEGYFTDKTSKRTIESLQTCGWEGSDLSEFSDGELHGLDANEVEFVIENESYEIQVEDEQTGEVRTEERSAARIQWINRPGSGGRLSVENAMKPEAAKAFGEKMRGLVLKVSAKNARPADDADFPFGANAPKKEEPKKTGTGGRRF